MMSADALKLRQDLRRDEGVRLKPYRCSMGKLTIGVGRLLDDAGGISSNEATILLDNDIARVEHGLDEYHPWWRSLPEPAARALINMAFQLGLGGLAKFKQTLAQLRAGDYTAAAEEALDSAWAKQTPERAKRVTDLFRSAGEHHG